MFCKRRIYGKLVEMLALDIMERGATGEIPAEVAHKILDENPRSGW